MKPETAVILATCDDWQTEFVFPAATEVKDIVKGSFEVLAFLPYDDSRELYTELFEDSHNTERVYRLAYFSSHGGNDALNRTSTSFFEHQMARFFTNSILVLTACLKDGELPKRVIKHGDHVDAVIGFEKRLLVPVETAANEMLGSWQSEFRELFCKALVEPVRSLVESKATVQEAKQNSRKRWGELDRKLMKRGHRRLRDVIFINQNRLQIWGDENRTLRS